MLHVQVLWLSWRALLSDVLLAVIPCLLQHTYASVTDPLPPCNLFGVCLDLIPSPWKWGQRVTPKFRYKLIVLQDTNTRKIYHLLILKEWPQHMIERLVCKLLWLFRNRSFSRQRNMSPKKFSLHRFFCLIIGLESRVYRYVLIYVFLCIASPKRFFVLGWIPRLLKVWHCKARW